jgi:hypothetical protein
MTFIQQWQTGGGGGGGGGGPAQHLSTNYNPLALYKLDEDLSDSSASGFNDLTVTGNEYYADVGLGLRGFYFDGNTTLTLASGGSALRLTGDMTLECILSIGLSDVGGQLLIYYGATGETEDTNLVYQLSTLTTTNELDYFGEYDAGVNFRYSPGICINPRETVLLGMVRSSNNVTFYINGVQAGAPSTGLPAPSGGTSGTFKIGYPNIDRGVMCSVKVVGSALSASDMKAEYNNSLGPVLGLIP